MFFLGNAIALHEVMSNAKFNVGEVYPSRLSAYVRGYPAGLRDIYNTPGAVRISTRANAE